MSLLTCKEFVDGISDFIDDDVAPELREKLQKHISECPNCWVVYNTTKKTIQVYKGMEAQPLPDDVRERLMKAIEKRIASGRGCAGPKME
jgi:anti-sigma factor (TIGR02949 family)